MCYYSTSTYLLKCFYGLGKEKRRKESQTDLPASGSTVKQDCQFDNASQAKEESELQAGQKEK